MRILIIGASGFVGRMMYDIFSDGNSTIGTYFSNPVNNMIPLDMTNKKIVNDVVSTINPDIIIHPAANPNVEYCELQPNETWHTNVDGTKNLIEAARIAGSKLVFFSSDYIFDGANGPYSELDSPNPICEYGRQKLAAEDFLTATLNNYLIIRTTVVYGWEPRGKNFAMSVINNLSHGKTMRTPDDQIGSPTYINNLATVVKELIELDKIGIFNVAGRDLIDRYSFALKIAYKFNLDDNLLIPTHTIDLCQKAKRPLKAGLKIEKTQSVVRNLILGVDDSLELMIQTGD